MMNDPVPLLHDYLVHSTRRNGAKVALVCDGQRVTYDQLEARSNSVAHHLVEAGVGRGDRVVIFADNTVEAAVSFWAVLKANAIVCLINPLTKRDKLCYLLDDCQPAALIAQARLYETFHQPANHCPSLHRVIVSGTIDDTDLNALPHAVGWSVATASTHNTAPARRCIDIDLAAIVYTSGSTGEPKGVMLTHRNMMTACTSIASYLDVREDEVILNALPLAFDYGLYQMIMAVRSGARLVLERSFAYPAEVLRHIAEERVTGFPGVPTMFSTLLQLDLKSCDLSSIRYVTSTGAALPVQHLRQLRDTFPGARIYSMYGLTECKRCTYLPPEDLDRKPSSVGIAIPNTEMWIVDERGQRVGPGVAGQLVIRGATVMKGYWRKPEATARRLKPGPLPGEQVLYTGDYCEMDAEGYLYFISRSDEIIKSRGEKVAPKEVESALLDIPGIREAAVVGVPDELLGHAVKAFVVVDVDQEQPISEKQIKQECQKRLESFMVPKYIVIVPELARTNVGKINKRELITG
ncbi:AMP-binding protein [Bradyrhizobium sp. B117]|uniref:class I adenylate-forming enzyme family protein n=1 Tax=Bradyrhizobium sp. B117 TaxID=3140246 RepID=UPI003182D5AD